MMWRQEKPTAAGEIAPGDVLIDLGPDAPKQDPAAAAAAAAVTAVIAPNTVGNPSAGTSSSVTSTAPISSTSPFLATSLASTAGSSAAAAAHSAAAAAANSSQNPAAVASLGGCSPTPPVPSSSTYTRESSGRSPRGTLTGQTHSQGQLSSLHNTGSGQSSAHAVNVGQPGPQAGADATAAGTAEQQRHHHQQQQPHSAIHSIAAAANQLLHQHQQHPEQQQQQHALRNLRQFSSQHYWLHDRPAADIAPAGFSSRMQPHHDTSSGNAEHGARGWAAAAGAAVRGLLGGRNALGSMQAGDQIGYPIAPHVDDDAEAAARRSSAFDFRDFIDEENAADSGSEAASPTKQSLLRNAFRQVSQEGPGCSSSSPLAGARIGSSNGGKQGSFSGLRSCSVSGNGSSRVARQGSGARGHSFIEGTQQQEQQQDGPECLRRGSGLLKTKKRWQAAAETVVHMKRVAGNFKPGSLQGLDVKRHNYDSWMGPLLHTHVNVTVTDYSHEQVTVNEDITNDTLADFLQQPRPEWSKVRWVNVQGLSWDAIQTLAVAYDLHPLSVEDIVHIPQRIKADYYQDYLYTSVILVSVGHPSKLDQDIIETEAAAAAAEAVAVASGGNTVAATEAAATAAAVLRQCTLRSASMSRAASKPAPPHKIHRLRTRLKRPSGRHAGDGIGEAASLHPMELLVEQASIFLFRDGTLITMFSHEGEGAAHGILEKLKGFKTLLTDSEDASFLFNAVLDAVVDHAMPVVQVYASRIAELESQVLLDKRPPARLTKELHLLGNDLKVLRRTLVPTQHLIHKLKETHADKDNSQRFLSPLTVVYLSDVLDHISTIVEDMETLSMDAKDLIDLVFNTIAHHNNNSMQMLAVVSTIFLPITFIAGVYGTNFDQWFPEIHWQWGYIYFWGICAAVTVVFVGMLKRWGLFTA